MLRRGSRVRTCTSRAIAPCYCNACRCIEYDHFIITASEDGCNVLEKTPGGIEFVKEYVAHVGKAADLAISTDGQQLCSIGAEDKTLKFYDVLNFDMTNMVDLEFVPSCCCWAITRSTFDPRVAVADADSGNVAVWKVFFHLHQSY